MILAASLPVALYAMIQRAGFDLLGLEIDRARVGSTLGHSTFLAGYLLMVAPLNIWRLLRLCRSLRDDSGSRGLTVAAIVFYSALAAIVLMGFLCAQSRGPLLGLGAALAFIAMGLSVRWRQWRLLKIAALLGACALGILLLLGMPNGPLRQWSSLPALQHFARTLPSGEEADWFRANIWQQAPKLMLSRTPLPFATRGEDRFHWLRAFIGYGPETLANVLPHFFTVPVINATRIELRFHNIIWDTWFGIGGFGLAAFLAFVVLLFFHGYRCLGWLESRRSEILFWALVLGGAVGGAGALWISNGAGFAGLGLVLGMVAGLMIHPLVGRPREGAANDLPEERATLLIVLLGAIVGHLVDMSFSFPTASTLLLFSVYSGFIIALVQSARHATGADRLAQKPPDGPGLEPGRKPRRQKPRKSGSPALDVGREPAWECAILAAIIICTIIFTFVRILPAEPLTLTGQFDAEHALSYFVSCETWCIVCVALLIGLAVFAGVVIARQAPSGEPRRAGNRWIAATAILLAIAVMVPTAIQPLRADVAAGWAETLMDAGLRQQSAAVSRLALALGPHDPVYLRILARALANSTGDLPDVGDADAISEAESHLIEVRNITSGMDPGTYELGRLYLSWAGWETRPEQVLALARKASAVFDQALIYDPLSPYTWNDSANVDLLYLNRPDDARRKLLRVAELVRNQRTEWGDYCSACSINAHDPNLQRQYETRAMEAYQSVIDDPKLEESAKAPCRLGQGNLLLAQGETDSALASLLEALKSPLGNRTWRAETGVGVIYLQQGKLEAAREYFTSALAHAPAEQKPRLTQLLAQTEQQ
jgi:tetratricopeptide (TPR) repeat protein/O-antigen ligase